MAVTVDDVLDQIAAASHFGSRTELIPAWTVIATAALASATRDVYGILTGRGLTPTQIATWTGFDSAVLSQSLFWAWEQGGPMQNSVPTEQKAPETFDLREWLKTAILTDATGAILIPSPALVGHGNIEGGWQDVSRKDPYRPNGPFIGTDGRMRRW